MTDSAYSLPTATNKMCHCGSLCSGLYATSDDLSTVAVVDGSTPILADRRAAMWLSYQDALEHVGVSRSTMHRWRQDGRGPSFKRMPNGAVVIRRDALESWFNDLPMTS